MSLPVFLQLYMCPRMLIEHMRVKFYNKNISSVRIHIIKMYQEATYIETKQAIIYYMLLHSLQLIVRCLSWEHKTGKSILIVMKSSKKIDCTKALIRLCTYEEFFI